MPIDTVDLPGLQTEPMVDYCDLVTAAQLVSAGRTGTATHEISVRNLPAHQPYLVNAGLEEIMDYLESFALGADELELLRLSPLGQCLPDECFEPLYEARFTGDLEAMPEGTVFFAGQPLLRLRGPAHELALVRHAILSYVMAAVPVATRASRLALATGGKPVYEIHGHRPGGRAASLLASRAAYIGGMAGTSNMDAACGHRVPVVALLEHGMLFCGADPDEAAQRLECLGGQVTVQLDPHQPTASLQDLLDLIQPLHGVALTGADPAKNARAIRKMLDGEGWKDTRILVSGDWDEQSLDFLTEPGVPVDGLLADLHGPIATRGGPLSLKNDLVEWESDGQRTPVLPPDLHGIVPQGSRMVYRQRGIGCYKQDTVQPDGTDPPARAVSLLVPMMQDGQRLSRSPSLGEVRALCVSQVQMLPEEVVRLHDFEPYLVEFPYEECQLLEEEGGTSVAAEGAADEGAGDECVEVSGLDQVKELLDSLDDSADFTFVSNMEDVVARGLVVEAAASGEASYEANGSSAEDGSEDSGIVEPLEPMEPAEAVRVMEAMADQETVQEEVAEPTLEEVVESPTDEVAESPTDEVEESPVEEVVESPVEEAASPTKETRKSKRKKKKNHKKNSPEAENEAKSEAPAKALDPIAAAAARLKAIKSGGGGGGPSPSAIGNSAVAEAAPAAAMTQVSECVDIKTSADPLAAAAARLKALKNGGGSAAPIPAEKKAELTEVSAVAPVKEKSDKLVSAADRLKALRNGG